MDVLLGAAAMVVAGVLLGREQAFFLAAPGPVSFDDGYTVALGERIIDGSWLPYVDGCSHRGPLLYWSVAISQKLSGRFNWFGPRFLSIALTYSTLFGVFAAGAAARRPIAGVIGALVYVYILQIYETGAAFGLLGESVASPFAIWSLAFTAIGITHAKRLGWRCSWLLLGGICAALAGLAKQTALAAIVPLACWALCAGWAERNLDAKRRLLLAASPLIGFSLAVAIVLTRYAAHRALGTFWYWFYQYNTQIYMEPYASLAIRSEIDGFFAREHWILLALALGVLACTAGFFGGLSRAEDKRAHIGGSGGFDLSLVMMTLGILFGAAAPLRFWGHYFVTLFPFGALIGGLGIERALGPPAMSSKVRFLARLVTVITLSSLVLYAADFRITALRRERRWGGWAPMQPEPFCDYISKFSAADSPIFIWGFDADLYITCGRRPATRFLYLTLVAGTVPGRSWTEIRPERVARGAREHVIQDLRQSMPPVILDMPGNMHGVSLRVVPEIVALLKSDYCEQKKIKSKSGREATPWLRKQDGRCPSSKG